MKKTCSLCKFYPNSCKYWDKKHRSSHNPQLSYVKKDTEHNCLDFRERRKK